MAYVMRISDWSSDVCSSDLSPISGRNCSRLAAARLARASTTGKAPKAWLAASISGVNLPANQLQMWRSAFFNSPSSGSACALNTPTRSEEHTSELQSLMRTSYAVFCLKKKNKNTQESHDSCLQSQITHTI